MGIENSNYALSEQFALFLETDSAQKGARSAKADAYFLNIALHFFNKVRQLESVNQIRLEDLQVFQLWLQKEQLLAPGKTKEPWSDPTIEYYSRVLKKFFRKMHQTDRIPKNPCELWKVPRGTSEQRRPMNEQEFDAIYKASPDWFQPILKFIRLTGARGASCAMLTWADINFESKTLFLKSRKGGLKQMKTIPIPMYPALFEFLNQAFLDVQDFEYPPRSYDPVFWGPKGTQVTAQEISSQGSRLIRKVVGLSGVVLYGLRHAIAVELTQAGVSLEITRQALGHSSLAQTSHYAKGIASSAVGDAFAQIRKSKPGAKS